MHTIQGGEAMDIIMPLMGVIGDGAGEAGTLAHHRELVFRSVCPFHQSPCLSCLCVLLVMEDGELISGGFAGPFPQQGFFAGQEWGGQMNFPPPGIMMGYPVPPVATNPMMEQGGPHGLKRQRDG